MTDQEIRAQALAVAVQLNQSGHVVQVTQTAALLAEWIRTGELPPPAPGTFY